MKRILRLIFQLLVFIILTVVTQVGGFIYLIFVLLSRYFKLSFLSGSLFFILFYLLSTFVFVPLIAAEFGREALPLSGPIRPLNLMTWVLNRQYVNADFNEIAVGVAIKMKTKYPETEVRYLDANFPFFDGFPLFPHLSHDDGKKLDLAFFYLHNGNPTGGAPSPIGYGKYVLPENNEENYAKICKEKGFWQYDAIGKVIPDWWSQGMQVDPERTKFLIGLLTELPKTSKIFLEPHLKERWKLNSPKIRFHGCHAVRHDDHIHWQIM